MIGKQEEYNKVQPKKLQLPCNLRYGLSFFFCNFQRDNVLVKLVNRWLDLKDQYWSAENTIDYWIESETPFRFIIKMNWNFQLTDFSYYIYMYNVVLLIIFKQIKLTGICKINLNKFWSEMYKVIKTILMHKEYLKGQ